MALSLKPAHLKRYKDIAGLLLKYGRGDLVERSGIDIDREEAVPEAGDGKPEELAAEMLATTLNVEFDPDKSWDEKKEVYRLSNKIVRTMNMTQSAIGDKRGKWTTTIAAAILIFE